MCAVAPWNPFPLLLLGLTAVLAPGSLAAAIHSIELSGRTVVSDRALRAAGSTSKLAFFLSLLPALGWMSQVAFDRWFAVRTMSESPMLLGVIAFSGIAFVVALAALMCHSDAAARERIRRQWTSFIT